tara:strand:- start:1153 stop:1380 length:228 start_codon:yes stop_codon:yes gene_type:complete
MSKKGFDAEINFQETPNLEVIADKPLKDNILNKRVDINVLKARAKAIQDKEYIKNTIVIILFLIIIVSSGIYLSS